MQQSSISIQRALISVYDKTNIIKIAQFLTKKNIQILSTEGTAQFLTNSAIPTLKISDYVKFPEIMDGKLKTLHYKIYADILSQNDIKNPTIQQYNIQPINMVIINFYPFHLAKDKKKFSHKKILEYIDIGGPSIVRAAAKNYMNVIVITNKQDYDNIIDEINNSNGYISFNTRLYLAHKAFKYVTEYDNEISNYFKNQLNTPHTQPVINKNNLKSNNYFPNNLTLMNLKFKKKQDMHYGENPHQKAAFYVELNLQNTCSIGTAEQLQGKDLSYNNIIDLDTALECVKMFSEPSCVIVKHSNPCGVSTANDIYTAYNQAYQSDSISAFGGIIAFNKPLDVKTTTAMINQKFVTAIIAPTISKECLNILSNKKNIRILSYDNDHSSSLYVSNIDFKRVNGGLLIQDYNNTQNLTKLEIVTARQPTTQEIQDSLFCWKIVKFVKSNAIVCGKNYQTTGIGAGQTSRVRSVQLATNAFHPNQQSKVQGSVMASDAFLSFSDSIQIACQMGIRCIIQPGGSIKDHEIINIANQLNIAMIFTRTRHFKH